MRGRGRQGDAAAYLEESGLDPEVIEIHTLKPLDCELLADSMRKTGALVTAEEHSVVGGLGSAVAEGLAPMGCGPIEFVALRDTFAESGDYEELLDKYGLSVDAIVAAAQTAIGNKE